MKLKLEDKIKLAQRKMQELKNGFQLHQQRKT